MKQGLKRCLIGVGAATLIAAGTLGVLSNNGVQQAIATAWLKDLGIEAQFGAWDSAWFSEFKLREVVLTAPDKTQLSIPEVTIRANVLSLIFTSNFSVGLSLEESARLRTMGEDFDLFLSRLALSNQAGEKNMLQGWFAATGTKASERIVFYGESENLADIPEWTLPAWITGTRQASLRVGETELRWENSGVWKIAAAEGISGESKLSGSGMLNAERVSGTLSARLDNAAIKALGFFKNLPPWAGEFQIDFGGDFIRGEVQIRHAFNVLVKNAAGTFAGFSLSPDLRLCGKGELEFAQASFSAKTFSADIAAVSQDAEPAIFAEVSIPGALTFSREEDGRFDMTAVGGGDELARLAFNKVPLALANPFLAHFIPGTSETHFSIDGTLQGELALKKGDEGKFVFAGDDSLRIDDFGLKRGETVFLEKISASVPVKLFLQTELLELYVDSAKFFGDGGMEIGSIRFAGTRDLVRKKTGLDVTAQAGAELLNQNVLKDYFSCMEERAIDAESSLKAEISDDEIAVSGFEFRILSRKDKVLLAARTEAFLCNVHNPLAGLEGKTVDLRANAFPLALLNPLACGKFYFSGTLDGEIAFVGSKNKIEFSTDGKTMAIRDFHMRDDCKLPLLNALSLQSEKNLLRIAQRENGEFQTVVDIQRGCLKNGSGRTVASGDLFLDFYGSKLVALKGTLFGDFKDVFEQPILMPLTNLGAGTFEMNGGLSEFGKASKFKLTCRNLRSRDRTLPGIERVDCSFEQGTFKNSDDVARAVLELQGEEHSLARVRFSRLDFDRESGITHFDARANAPKIVPLDFYALGKILEPAEDLNQTTESPETDLGTKREIAPKSSDSNVIADSHTDLQTSPEIVPAAPSERVPQTQVTPSTESEQNVPPSLRKPSVPWKRFIGNVDFEIDSLIVPDNELHGFSGDLILSPERAEFIAKTRTFFGGTFDFNSLVELRESEKPFAARAKVTVRESNLNEAIPLLREKNPPMLEGKFDIDLWAKSEAESFESLRDHVSAKAKLIGREGRIRIFASDNKQMRSVSGLAQLGGDMIGLFGSLAGGFSERAGRIGNAVRDLQKYLDDFPFDTHEVDLTYASGGPVECNKFLLQNEILRISGIGEIACSPELEIRDFPISATARLDVRGDLEELLRVLNVLKKDRDPATTPEDDYVLGPEFKFSGTLNHMSDNLLETLLSAGKGLGL